MNRQKATLLVEADTDLEMALFSLETTENDRCDAYATRTKCEVPWI